MKKNALVRQSQMEQNDSVAANKTLHMWYINYHRGWWWGGGLMGYWAFLMLVSSIDHLSSIFFPHASMKAKQMIGQLAPVRWTRRSLTMPALFNHKHTERNFIGGVIPTRFESLVIFIYFVLVILSESVNIYYYDKFVWYSDKKTQLARYVGDRSAVITCFICIPVFLFAGRNNFLLWTTGWKMSTFYTFHKWLARMAIFSAFVHTITMFEVMKWSHSIQKVKTEKWWIWGAVAMTSGAVIFVQSFPYLRAKIYDFVLYCHIVLALFWLIGMWIHVRDLGSGQYAYACGTLWALERFLRLLKMASFGIRKAHLELISDEIVVMTVPDIAPIKRPTPGSFGYVYFLDSWFFFQSHPFSLILDGYDIKFLIKGKDGITKSLVNRMRHQPQSRYTVNVLLEAFYGEYKTAYAYDEVIVIAGGNGVVGLYEYVKDIDEKKRQGKSHTKYVRFYWIIRHWHSIDWFYTELQKLQRFTYVQPIVYVTRYADYNIGNRFKCENDISSLENKLKTAHHNHQYSQSTIELLKRDLPHVQFKSSRPDVKQLIHNAVKEASPCHNLIFLSCAINQICDDVRQSVVQEASIPRPGRIDLSELLQTW